MGISYLTTLALDDKPKGPDGQGRNRLAINVMEPSPRCLLRPRSRQAALDYLRGIHLPELATYYDGCTHPKNECNKCVRATRARESWRPEWIVREDPSKQVWLLDNSKLGFAASGRCFGSWRALLDEVAVPELKRKSDLTGFFWQAQT